MTVLFDKECKECETHNISIKIEHNTCSVDLLNYMEQVLRYIQGLLFLVFEKSYNSWAIDQTFLLEALCKIF